MKRLSKQLLFLPLLATLAAQCGYAQSAQKALTWQEVRDKFEAANPSLRAGQIGIDESKANETTAYLRPNPNLSLLADQIDPFPGGPSHGAFAYWLPSATVTYLHERQHKRELRLDSAKEATGIAISSQADVSDPKAVARMFDAAQAAFGGVDVLVNNAGIMQLAPLADSDDALFDRQVAINLKGSFNTMREAARRQRAEIDDLVTTLSGNLDKIAEHGKRADGIVKSMLSHSRGGSIT